MLRFSRKFEKLFSKRLLSSNESALAEKMKATETVYPLQKINYGDTVSPSTPFA